MNFDFGSFLGDFFNNAKNWLTDFLNEIQGVILMLLPDSPFKNFTVPTQIQEILGYINWIVPFYLIGNTLLLWTGAITVYYAYQLILRWIKTIE